MQIALQFRAAGLSTSAKTRSFVQSVRDLQSRLLFVTDNIGSYGSDQGTFRQAERPAEPYSSL